MTAVAFKNTRVVRSSWLEEGGRRLDCNPYMSGALEARDGLRALSTPKEPLKSLTKGHAGGIYNGPKFSRVWVDDPTYGVPFLSNSDMLNADFPRLPHLKEDYAKSRYLSYLQLQEHTTLITCSGTIGRMSYVRPDMAGMWSSQHIMKVVPDAGLIAPGYLYAFLSGKYGVPLVVSGTYGAIIQHIEPEHVADLPVPRFGIEFETKVHDLVVDAAKRRTEASDVLKRAIKSLLDAASLPPLSTPPSVTPFSVGSADASQVQRRLDAFFHSTYRKAAVQAIQDCGLPADNLASLAASVEEPNRFKRIVLGSDSGGVPLFGTSSIFWADPEPSYYLPRKLAAPYVVTRRTVLVPRSGQLSGVIGFPVLPYGDIIGAAVSEDAIRVHCKSEIDAGLLFVFLSSEYGTRQLKARAFGSSIPHLDVRQIGACLIPKVQSSDWQRIGAEGLRVSELRGQAIVLERKARSMVEEKISQGE